MNKKRIFFIIIIILLIAGLSTGMCAIIISVIKDESERRSIIEQKNAHIEIELYKTNLQNDSMRMIIENLSQYETLTRSLLLRDDSRKNIKQVGEQVTSKIDSSNAIVTDIIVGGSQFNYYVKYEITYPSGNVKIIDPSLVW